MAKKQPFKAEIDEVLENWIMDDIDWDQIKTKSQLVKYGQEDVVANLEDYGIKKFTDLTKKQQRSVTADINDEWKCYIQNITNS